MRIPAVFVQSQINMPNSDKSSPRTEPDVPDLTTASNSKWELRFDGASRDNCTRGGTGAVLKAPDGSIVKEMSENIGPATSNEAEYKALHSGLEEALKQRCQEIQVFGDSQLVVKQVKGDWRVSAANLKPLHDKVVDLAKKFKRFEISHVPRKENVEADRLASSAVENHGSTDKLGHYMAEYGELDSGSEDYEVSDDQCTGGHQQGHRGCNYESSSSGYEDCSEVASYEDLEDFGYTKCVSSYNDESESEYLESSLEAEPYESASEEDPDTDETEGQSEQNPESESDDEAGSDEQSVDSAATSSDGPDEYEVDSAPEAADYDDSLDEDDCLSDVAGYLSDEAGYESDDFDSDDLGSD